MGDGEGEGEGHGYVVDMHPLPHLPEASDRTCRPRVAHSLRQYNAVPDLAYTVVDRVAEGDNHQGGFFGVPGTCNRIEMSSIQIDPFGERGQVVEEWPKYDLLGAMRQTGKLSEVCCR